MAEEVQRNKKKSDHYKTKKYSKRNEHLKP